MQLWSKRIRSAGMSAALWTLLGATSASAQPYPWPASPILLEQQGDVNPITLRWGPGYGGTPPDSYTLVASSTSALNGDLGEFPMGTARSIVVNAPLHRTIWVRVRAQNQYGATESNDIQVRVRATPTSILPPSPPLAFFDPPLSGDPLTVFWRVGERSGPPARYLVQVGTTPETFELGTLNVGLATQISGHIPRDQWFYVRVIAQNSEGEAVSNRLDVMLPSGPAPMAPILNPPVVTGSTVSLSWSSESLVHTLVARLTPTGPVVASLRPPYPLSSIQIPNVASGEYFVSVIAHYYGLSTESNQVSVVVP